MEARSLAGKVSAAGLRTLLAFDPHPLLRDDTQHGCGLTPRVIRFPDVQGKYREFLHYGAVIVRGSAATMRRSRISRWTDKRRSCVISSELAQFIL